MNESKFANPAVLQLQLNQLASDMVQMRCEAVVQQKFWYQQQLRLEQDNQLLSLALLQSGALNTSTQARLQQLSCDNQYDALTQTLNRNIMLDRIGHAISMAKRQHKQFALLFIDLDNFKPINDQHGHSAGDDALKQVSQRILSAIRSSDAVSRHGGDEFLVLLTDVKNRADVIAFTRKLGKSLTKPYQIHGHEIKLSASIGIALYPDHASTAATLISYADAGMYKAKKQGGGRAC